MYKIKKIENLNEWEEFVKKQDFSLFVQSSNWGELYKTLGEKSWIIGIYKREKLVGGSLVVSTHAKRGNFLFLPYGPILDYTDKHAFSILITYLKKFAKENKYNFIRVSPYIDNNKKNKEIFKENGFRPSPIHIIAENTWLLKLDKDNEDLLSEMKKNHRNLIRRCQREGVTVKKLTDKKALERLNDMHDTVVKRHNFFRFSRKFITNEFNQFSKNDNALIFESKLPDGTIDASAIIIFYGTMACYRHSASLNTNKKLPSSYLIQWEVIKEAKKRGMKWYNFWGIAPENSSSKHPFKGITHFKTGFSGETKNLLPCQDLKISKKYWFNWVIETARRIKRGF